MRFGESLGEAVSRIALRELGIKVQKTAGKGYIEYPSHYKHGLDSPVGIVFEITEYTGELHVNHEAEESGWFRRLPERIHPDQDTFLLRNGYLTQ